MAEREHKPRYFCQLCDVYTPNESSFECHIRGKKHKQKVERFQSIEEEAERSVFVGNCMHLTAAELSLADYFAMFGAVAKITVDKNRGSFAIVEFDDKKSASAVLDVDNHEVMGVKLCVKPREAKLPTSKHIESDKHHPVHQQMEGAIWNMLLDANTVETQFSAIKSNLSLNDNEKHVRNLLCQLLTAALEEVFHSCEITAFGSSANGIGFHGCDVDLNLSYSSVDYARATQFLSQRGVDEKVDTEFGSKEVLEISSSIIKNCVPDCYQVKAILSARRPVVKFRHKASGISCDLSVGNDLAVRNTTFLHHICDSVSYFTPLVQTIKLWMKHWGLAGSLKAASPLLNSYAVTMLVLFYLHQSDELHSLNELRRQDETLQPHMIDDWDCSFSKVDPRKSSDTKSLQVIFVGFFKFYAKFEFAKKVICLNSGVSEDIKDFYAKNGAVADGFKLGHLNIQDPFELNHNVAGNVGQKHMKTFTKCIRNAALACDMKLFQKHIDNSSKEPWGILCLFVDHHGKHASRSPTESSTSQANTIELPDISENERNHIVALIITILTDVFMMTLVPQKECDTKTAEMNLGSTPESTTSNATLCDVSRKRRIDDATPASKRPKLSLSSPEAAELFEKVLIKSAGDTESHMFPVAFKCEVKYKLWEGRRKVRRQIVRPDVKEIMDLEKEVSRLLIAESHSHEESFESNSAKDISTSFLVDVCISLNDTALTVNFACDGALHSSSNQNPAQDFKNMVHHMKLSLSGMVKKCLKNTKIDPPSKTA